MDRLNNVGAHVRNASQRNRRGISGASSWPARRVLRSARSRPPTLRPRSGWARRSSTIRDGG